MYPSNLATILGRLCEVFRRKMSKRFCQNFVQKKKNWSKILLGMEKRKRSENRHFETPLKPNKDLGNFCQIFKTFFDQTETQ
jgi:hypothetical protein